MTQKAIKRDEPANTRADILKGWNALFSRCLAPDGIETMGLADVASVAELVYACRALAERCAELEARVRTLERKARPGGQ